MLVPLSWLKEYVDIDEPYRFIKQKLIDYKVKMIVSLNVVLRLRLRRMVKLQL